MFPFPVIRKVYEGVASRHDMYALFNRHAQAPFDDYRMVGTRYVGEWFEITEDDHERMFEILPPLFYRGDMFAMREFLAESVTSVFFALAIGGQVRWFQGYCDLSASRSANTASPQPVSPDWMRAAILERESRTDRAMTRLEKLDHIWSTTGAGLRAYAVDRFSPDFRGRQIVTVFSGPRARSGSCSTTLPTRRSPQSCLSSFATRAGPRPHEPAFEQAACALAHETRPSPIRNQASLQRPCQEGRL